MGRFKPVLKLPLPMLTASCVQLVISMPATNSGLAQWTSRFGLRGIGAENGEVSISNSFKLGRRLHLRHEFFLAGGQLLADLHQVHVTLAELGEEFALLFLHVMLHVFAEHLNMCLE